VKADVREGLRPLGDILNGRTSLKGCPDDWTLGTGHVKFMRKHLAFTIIHWLECQDRYKELGYEGYNMSLYLSNVPEPFLKDYIPTKKAMRSNLARIISRWRNRKTKYHFNKKLIDTRKDMLQYIQHVKTENNL
jgi:hypothetical protein